MEQSGTKNDRRIGITVLCHCCRQEVAGKGVFTGDAQLAFTKPHHSNGEICEGTGHFNPIVT